MARLLLLLLARLASTLCDPLVQSHRPPQQTTVQSAAQARLVSDAHTQSQNARGWVLNYLKTEVIPALQGTTLGSMSGEELLERLDWEFKRMPIIHNGLLDGSDQAQIQDDSDLPTTMTNGYLQNVCQRWVLGARSQSSNHLVYEHNIMTQYMGLPAFARGEDNPTLREANSCVMYLATNICKTHCGNFVFGSVTYVINPLYRDKFAIMPFDSGALAPRHSSDVVFGTLEDYYHVFKHHVTVLDYNFASVFRRWYLNEPPPHLGKFPYMEIEWLGNAWFPESMLYVIVKFSGGPGVGVWGTELGRTLQNSMRYRGRPVIWADGDNSGMLIDGTVNMIEGGRIGQEASDYFNNNWQSGISWQDFYNYSPEYLKFFYPQYERKELCEEVEQNPGYMVMGHDRLGNCVYWAWFSFPTKWECLNDGNCELSDSDRAVFSSEQDCMQSCGWGKWACVQGDPAARSGAHHCEPNADSGHCHDVDTCEANCGLGGTCPNAVTATAATLPWLRSQPTFV